MVKRKITKNMFVELIKSLQQQEIHDEKCNEAFQVILPDSMISFYNNEYIKNGIIKFLKQVFNDNDKRDSDIEYFIYDLNFGKDYKDGMITDGDGKNIDLSTAEKLFDYLNNKEK